MLKKSVYEWRRRMKWMETSGEYERMFSLVSWEVYTRTWTDFHSPSFKMINIFRLKVHLL